MRVENIARGTLGRASPTARMPASLTVDRVSKVFPGRAGAPPLEVLKAVSFSAGHGEFISIIGRAAAARPRSCASCMGSTP
jgi:ABC-type histidine transport system ATPase subunit